MTIFFYTTRSLFYRRLLIYVFVKETESRGTDSSGSLLRRSRSPRLPRTSGAAKVLINIPRFWKAATRTHLNRTRHTGHQYRTRHISTGHGTSIPSVLTWRNVQDNIKVFTIEHRHVGVLVYTSTHRHNWTSLVYHKCNSTIRNCLIHQHK